jgi:hypothetical protein
MDITGAARRVLQHSGRTQGTAAPATKTEPAAETRARAKVPCLQGPRFKEGPATRSKPDAIGHAARAADQPRLTRSPSSGDSLIGRISAGPEPLCAWARLLTGAACLFAASLAKRRARRRGIFSWMARASAWYSSHALAPSRACCSFLNAHSARALASSELMELLRFWMLFLAVASCGNRRANGCLALWPQSNIQRVSFVQLTWRGNLPSVASRVRVPVGGMSLLRRCRPPNLGPVRK